MKFLPGALHISLRSDNIPLTDMSDKEVTYKIIGYIHSPFTEQDHTPIQSIFSDAPGTVEVLPEYAEGLKDIEGFSHIILVYHFHQAKGYSLLQKPFMDNPNERGIFSIRHFARPNPIGFSVVELKAVKNNVLEVTGIDVLDGTPLLDIKPYVEQFDCKHTVKSGWAQAWIKRVRCTRHTGCRIKGITISRIFLPEKLTYAGDAIFGHTLVNLLRYAINSPAVVPYGVDHGTHKVENGAYHVNAFDGLPAGFFTWSAGQDHHDRLFLGL